VNINVGSGTGGFDINGVNGGAVKDRLRRINDFPIYGNRNVLYLANDFYGTSGLSGFSTNFQLAVSSTSGDARIKNFASSTSISSSSLFNSN
jgi:hypothetical protein